VDPREAARAALSEDAYQRFRDEGREMTIDEAAAYAIQAATLADEQHKRPGVEVAAVARPDRGPSGDDEAPR
jgi:hypothetical protein